ncbi:hypothetical protein L7F22_022237 [Adiantum nelumboides]|nr:hypothetical protein [Adiantum nelumboides]
MVRFYCFNDREVGVALMAKATMKPYAPALYSLAMRELGHCLQDGYKVPKNVPKGRHLLLEANAQEATAAIAASPRDFLETALHLALSTRSRCLPHGLHHRLATAIHKLEAAHWAAISAKVAIQTLCHPGGMARQGTGEQGTGQTLFCYIAILFINFFTEGHACF